MMLSQEKKVLVGSESMRMAGRWRILTPSTNLNIQDRNGDTPAIFSLKNKRKAKTRSRYFIVLRLANKNLRYC